MAISRPPKISILFPVFNGARFLEQTLDTVVRQTCRDWELIAMDGGSTDGTLDILATYARKHPNIHIYSEPDEGGFHAITKAAEKARGENICLLCASDGYLDDAWFEKCIKVITTDPHVSLVWGVPFHMDEAGSLLGPSFVYAHYLSEKDPFNKMSVIRKIISKIDLRKPSSIWKFLRKMHFANVTAVGHMLKRETPPQKQDWFSYWLATGTPFPDGNMLMSRRVFFECFPKYVLGSRDPGDFTAFNFCFNAKGYLAFCLPQPANFGRTHSGQVGEQVQSYNDAVTEKYFKKLEDFRNKVHAATTRVTFVDRTGEPIG